MKSKLLRLLRAPLLAYVAICGFVGACQRTLIYHPIHGSESEMLAEASYAHCEPWRDASNAIIGWKSAKRAGQPIAANRVVVFDGNTGYALNRGYILTGSSGSPAGKTGKCISSNIRATAHAPAR